MRSNRHAVSTSINKGVQVVLNWFSLLNIFTIFNDHVQNKSLSEPIFDSELEDKISSLSMLSATLENLIF